MKVEDCSVSLKFRRERGFLVVGLGWRWQRGVEFRCELFAARNDELFGSLKAYNHVLKLCLFYFYLFA